MSSGAKETTAVAKIPRAGEAIVTIVRFADSVNPKIWPALLLFEELGNMVKAGISINLRMRGIPITKAEGAAQD